MSIARASPVLEVAAATRLGAWQVDANAMLVRPLDTGRDERLLRRAPYTLNASVAYDAGAWRAGIEATHAGARADLDINTFQRTSNSRPTPWRAWWSRCGRATSC
jgi:outer membrane cobalamin receptor